MSLIDKGSNDNELNFEQKKIYDWACKNSKENITRDIFSAFQKNEDSYYSRFDNKNNIRSFSFESTMELNELLRNNWAGNEVMESISMVCAVAAFKEKDGENILEMNGQEGQHQANENKEIPDFIYAF